LAEKPLRFELISSKLKSKKDGSSSDLVYPAGDKLKTEIITHLREGDNRWEHQLLRIKQRTDNLYDIRHFPQHMAANNR
jgi:hypothetical protein